MAQQETIMARLPTITLSFAFFSLIVYSWPNLQDLFVYDRQAILKGEAWRLITAPFVHFSPSHIFWDIVVFVAAGWRIEAAGYRRYWLVCCLAALIPGPIFLLVSPELARYGGLSGLATGAVVYLSLCEAKGTDRNRIPWLTILALTGIKVIIEFVTGAPIFTSATDMQFRVLPSVHVVGIVAALAALLWAWPSKGLHSVAGEPRR